MSRSPNPITGAILALALTIPIASVSGQPTSPAGRPGEVVIEFTQGDSLTVAVVDETLELITPYGKLEIPVQDIHQIEFATRIDEETARRIDAAIVNLGARDFKSREVASADLLAYEAKAYPALLKAVESTDQEVARRAQTLIDQIRERVPSERLEIREDDIVHTAKSVIAGRIAVDSLQVNTIPFGEQALNLSGVRDLRSRAMAPRTPENVLADPGNLTQFQGQVGQTLYFRVTGALNGSVWGTDLYTADSNLATAAVHAGILQNGQEGILKVTMMPPPAGFTGSTRNGITSSSYGMYPSAFKISR